MAAPKYLDIEVIQADIDEANAYDEAFRKGESPSYSRSAHCPVANALKRMTSFEASVQVGYLRVSFDADSPYVQYEGTKKLTKYIDRADEPLKPNVWVFGNHTNGVKPAKFRVRLRDYS